MTLVDISSQTAFLCAYKAKTLFKSIFLVVYADLPFPLKIPLSGEITWSLSFLRTIGGKRRKTCRILNEIETEIWLPRQKPNNSGRVIAFTSNICIQSGPQKVQGPTFPLVNNAWYKIFLLF